MARTKKPKPAQANPLDALVERAGSDVLEEETSPPVASQTTPLSHLHVEPGHNPRSEFGQEGLRDLAQTIAAGGLYQPLTVRSDPTRPGHYLIIAGERRHRALLLLVEEGRIQPDYPVPIYVRDDLDERTGRLVAALIENLQQEPLAPLEEAEAFAELRDELGLSTEEIALRVGKSQPVVQQRLRLLRLSDPVRAALREGELPVTVARALASAPPHLQQEGLARFRQAPPSHQNESAMRRFLRSQAIPLSRALFAPDHYADAGGETFSSEQTVDRSPGAHNTYFTDRELFVRLQREAIAEQHALLQERYEWVDEIEASRLPPEYEPTGSGSGAVILYRQGLFDVEILTGVERAASARTRATTSARRAAPDQPEPQPEDFVRPPSKARLRRAAKTRNCWLQEALAGDPDTALRVALAAMLTRSPSVGVRFEPPAAEQRPEAPPRIAQVVRSLGELLGVEEPSRLLTPGAVALDEADVYRRLRAVPSGMVQAALSALVAHSTGVWFDDSGPHPFTPPLLAELFGDLAVDVADWRPTLEDLEEYTTEELRLLANRFEVEVPRGASKSELITKLLASERFSNDYRAPELALRSPKSQG